MTGRPLVRRRLARLDIEAATDHYRKAAGEKLAVAFLEALKSALDLIATHPGAGAPHSAEAAPITGLRSQPLTRFPYMLLYVEKPEQIEVVRLLHQHRDIPAILKSEDL